MPKTERKIYRCSCGVIVRTEDSVKKECITESMVCPRCVAGFAYDVGLRVPKSFANKEKSNERISYS